MSSVRQPTSIVDFPDMVPAPNEPEPAKRISSFKRAICQLVNMPPEGDEGDIVNLVRTMAGQVKGANSTTGELIATKEKLKGLRKKLLLLAMDEGLAD